VGWPWSSTCRPRHLDRARFLRNERSVYLQYDGDGSFFLLEHVDGVGGGEIGLSVRWKWR
jgi:hypothetical protein